MNLSGKKILVTGGCGLIGSTIIDQVLFAYPDARVVVVDNLSRGTLLNLEEARKSGRVELFQEDIRYFDRIRPLFDGVDAVFHQAAIRITRCAQEPRECLEVLVDGTFNVLQASVEAGVKRLVAASSASIYGLADEFPTTEMHHPYNNRTLYGAAKIANEGMLRSYYDMFGLPYVALRYFNVYGPRMDVFGKYTEVLIRWLDCLDRGDRPKIFGDGLQTMDFVHVADVAKANVLAMESETTDQVFNVASGVETSLLGLLQALLRVTGKEHVTPEFLPERAVNPVPRRLADTSKASGMLGFTAKMSLDEGLQQLVKWRRELIARGQQADYEGAPNALDSHKVTLMMIPITKPYYGVEEAEAARQAVESGWITQGPRVAEFERMFAAYCGTSEAVAVSNCTTALHLALVVLDIGPGDEVICPSMSFIATANSIHYTGAVPVFADVDPHTYNLDPDAAEAAITPRTKAIMVVHQIGLPVDLDRFHEIGRRRGVSIVEDAACAIGSRYKGRPIGGHSDLVCFSFHPRKVITTGEGGMITTSNSRYAARLRLLRQHGMSVPDTVRHAAKTVIAEQYVCVGYNYRMTDIQAAIGIEQMKRLDWIVARRRELADRYTSALAGHPWLRPPSIPNYAETNYQSYAVQLTDAAPVSRDDLMQHLLERDIASRRGIMLAHREPAYEGHCASGRLDNSEIASAKSILLPLFPDMKDMQVDAVCGALMDAFSTHERI